MIFPAPFFIGAIVRREEVLAVRKYECMYILHPGLDEEKYTQLVEKFNNIVVEQAGVIDQVDLWGKRRMAYEVNKLREGYYVLFLFQGEPAVAQELERVLKITDGVIKHLLTRREELKAGEIKTEEVKDDEPQVEVKEEKPVAIETAVVDSKPEKAEEEPQKPVEEVKEEPKAKAKAEEPETKKPRAKKAEAEAEAIAEDAAVKEETKAKKPRAKKAKPEAEAIAEDTAVKEEPKAKKPRAKKAKPEAEAEIKAEKNETEK